jgi:hypothetical protein
MTRLFIACIVVIALILGGWFLFRGGGLVDVGGISPRFVGAVATVESNYVVPELDNNYRNDEYKFSLRMPEGFTAAELPEDENGGKAITFQDSQGNGIQVYVLPFSGDTQTLTADMIRRDIPDMQVESVQEVEIGNNRGVAFLSDNEAYGGKSREVWFIFRGNLYQISTYAHLDNLLQTMIATWKFN